MIPQQKESNSLAQNTLIYKQSTHMYDRIKSIFFKKEKNFKQYIIKATHDLNYL